MQFLFPSYHSSTPGPSAADGMVRIQIESRDFPRAIRQPSPREILGRIDVACDPPTRGSVLDAARCRIAGGGGAGLQKSELQFTDQGIYEASLNRSVYYAIVVVVVVVVSSSIIIWSFITAFLASNIIPIISSQSISRLQQFSSPLPPLRPRSSSCRITSYSPNPPQ